MSAEQSHRPHRRPRPRRRGVRIGALLFAFAILPLTGAVAFAVAELQKASTVLEEVAVTDELTQELIDLTDLRSRLVDEYNWSIVTTGLVAVGLPPELVGQMTRVDILGGQRTAIDEVDSLIAEIGITDMTAKLTELRARGQAATLVSTRQFDLIDYFADEYAALEGTVVRRSDEVLDRLVTIAGSVDGGERLLTALRVLESAAESRQSIASQQIGFFITQFSDVVLPELIEQHAVFERSVAQMTLLAPAGSRASVALETIEADGDTADFMHTVDELIAVRLAALGGDEGVLLADVVGELARIVERYESGVVAVEGHLALLAAAGADVVEAGDDLLRDADANRTRSQGTIVLLIVVSILFSIVLTRVIVRPLRHLSTSARLLKDGATGVTSESRGPVEVRDAATAIKEAATYLELVEQQATALANRDLDNPILAEEAEGSLGRSLQSAVKTLAVSINAGEEYRRQLAHDADHDSLTQLPNRRASLSRLEHGLSRSRRSGTQLAVLFLDLDGFKAVNDRHGHLAGDVVLQAVTARMRATVRDGDHVGRFGGDEFLVIAEDVDGAEGAVALGERLIRVIETPIEVNRTTVTVGASIGIALPSDAGLTPDEILRNADLAVYRAKQAGRRRVELADDDPRLLTSD